MGGKCQNHIYKTRQIFSYSISKEFSCSVSEFSYIVSAFSGNFKKILVPLISTGTGTVYLSKCITQIKDTDSLTHRTRTRAKRTPKLLNYVKLFRAKTVGVCRKYHKWPATHSDKLFDAMTASNYRPGTKKEISLTCGD